MLLKEPSFLNI